MIFQSARRIKSFFPYKDMIKRFQMSKVVYKATCWDCQDFYIGKTKRKLHDRKTEHFKGITSTCHASAIADHVTSTVRLDTHCKIKPGDSTNSGTQTNPKRYCQQRKALSVLVCIFNANFLRFCHCYCKIVTYLIVL